MGLYTKALGRCVCVYFVIPRVSSDLIKTNKQATPQNQQQKTENKQENPELKYILYFRDECQIRADILVSCHLSTIEKTPWGKKGVCALKEGPVTETH